MSRRLTLALLVLAAVPARGDTVDATATTLIFGHAEARDGQVHTVVPIIEQLDLRATELRAPGFQDLQAVVSSWGELAPGDPRDGRFVTGDVDVAYLEGNLLHRRLELRAGRQLVFGGAARTLALDGLSTTAHAGAGFALSGFAGVPVTPRFAVSRGDVAAGGRLFWQRGLSAEVGVSAIDVLDAGRVARQDAALDARWAPGPVTLGGYALWSLYERRLAELELRAGFQPARTMEFTVDYRRTAPDLFVPRSSLFAVFADQQRDEVGGSLFWQPRPRISFGGDYHAISEPDGVGQTGAGRVVLHWGGQSSLGAEARELHLSDNGYFATRVFGSQRVSCKLVGTVDLGASFYQQGINGQRHSLSGQATALYQLAPAWRGALTLLAQTTPLAVHEVDVLARLVYHFELSFHEVHK